MKKDRSKYIKEETKRIGLLVSCARKLKGYSLTMVSRHIGVSQQQLMKYESGRDKLSVPRFVMLSNFIDLDTKFVLSDASSLTDD